MIPVFVFGINHTSAPVAVREQVAFAPEYLPVALADIVEKTQVIEAAIISTCNRTELYVTVDANEEMDVGGVVEMLLQWLSHYHDLPSASLRQCSYCHYAQQAIRHMMCVACGLDSLVLGEPQILGQMKSSYVVAQNAGTLSSQLHRAFQRTFAVAKKVRTQTAIGENPVSVAYAAVSMSQQIFTDLSQERALLIGAGETIDLVARHLHQQGIKKMVFANRTLERAQGLAEEFGASAVLLSDIPEALVTADIVISSTASQLPILGKGAVETALKLRKHQPVFMVDLAVPRDIEAEVGALEDIYLYTVDDLAQVVDDNRRSREYAACAAHRLIDEALEEYIQEVRARYSVSVIKNYRRYAESLRDQALAKAMRDLQNGLPADDVLTQMANSLTNKLLHAPTSQLRQAGSDGDHELLSLTKKLFAVHDGRLQNKKPY